MATAVNTVTAYDFFDPDSSIVSHGGNFELAEGDYIWTNLEVRMFDGWDGKQEARLGVMITLVPLDNPDAKPLTAIGQEHEGSIFYSMGTKAALSFSPNAEGTGIEAVPGGTGKIPDSSNWIILAKSLRDSGLPKGTATNDVSVLIGIHVHMMNVPEPEERKGFQSNTAEVAADRKQYKRNIAIVSEIKEDGKPWEGTGGIPDVKSSKKGLVKVPPKAQAKPVAEVEPEELTEEVMTAALGAMAAVLEKAPKAGTPRAAFKLNVAKEVKKTHDNDMMNAVVSGVLENEEILTTLLDSLDSKISGPMVKAK